MLWAAHAGELEIRRAGGATRLRGSFPYGKAAVLSDGGRSGRPQKETFESEAFSYRVDDDDEDIHLLVGHDYDMPLASKLTGSLVLRDTPKALLFDATIPPAVAETTHARDALALIEAGLATGISPGFRIPPQRAVPDAESVEEEEFDPARGLFGALIRHVKQALLYELSIVTKPAYSDAQVQMRNWTLGGKSKLIVPEAPDAGLHRTLARWRA
jgi:HK97 family phage prohead protease